jgi:hypothetical protein
MCPIQIQSFLIFLDIPDRILKRSWKAITIKHLLVSDNSEWEIAADKVLFKHILISPTLLSWLTHTPSRNLYITDVLSHYTPNFFQCLMNAKYMIISWYVEIHIDDPHQFRLHMELIGQFIITCQKPW